MTESSLFGVSRQSFLYESNFGINCRYNYRIYSNTTHRSIYRCRNNSSYCYYFLHNIYSLAKRIAKNIPKTERRKLATNGIFPFIFLLMMFMIVVYTGLYQFMAR